MKRKLFYILAFAAFFASVSFVSEVNAAELEESWVRSHNFGATSHQWVTDTAVDSKGNIIVTGWADTGTDIGSHTIKYSSDGSYLGSHFNTNLVNDAIKIQAGLNGESYIVTPEGLVIKYGDTVNKLWDSSFIADYFGGYTYMVGSSVGTDGSFYVSAFGFKDTDSFFDHQVLTVKFQQGSTGTPIWHKSKGGLPIHWANKPAVHVSTNGNVFVSAGNRLLTYSSDGLVLSDFQSRNTSSLDVRGTDNGSIYAVDIYFNIVKYDLIGILDWHVKEPGASALFIDIDSSGNVYAGGNGNSVALGKKYSSVDGADLGTATYGSNFTWMNDGVYDGLGNIFTTGFYYNTITGTYDALTVKLNAETGEAVPYYYDLGALEMMITVSTDSTGSVYGGGYTGAWSVEKNKYLNSYLTVKYSEPATHGKCEPILALMELLSSSNIEHKGMLSSLGSKLESAHKKCLAGNNKTAVNILEAFINELEAQSGKKVPDEVSVLLIEAAEGAIEVLSGF